MSNSEETTETTEAAKQAGSECSDLLAVFAVWIVGHDEYPVAIFRYQEQAEEWARDNYFGNWLMKEVRIRLPPFATKAEWEAAKIEGAKLAAKFDHLGLV